MPIQRGERSPSAGGIKVDGKPESNPRAYVPEASVDLTQRGVHPDRIERGIDGWLRKNPGT